MNPFDLLKNLDMANLKKKAEEAFSGLKDTEITGESGGGFVKVKINGEFNILSIEYEDNDIVKEDISMFKDLIIAAHNNAVEKLRDVIKNKIGSDFSNL